MHLPIALTIIHLFPFLAWMNSCVEYSLDKIEDLCTGAAYCECMDIMFPGYGNGTGIETICTGTGCTCTCTCTCAGTSTSTGTGAGTGTGTGTGTCTGTGTGTHTGHDHHCHHDQRFRGSAVLSFSFPPTPVRSMPRLPCPSLETMCPHVGMIIKNKY